jgi:hypothetical protein
MPLLARRNLFRDEVRLNTCTMARTHPVCDRHTNLQMIPCGVLPTLIMVKIVARPSQRITPPSAGPHLCKVIPSHPSSSE